MITRPDGTRLAWIAGQHLDIEVINRAVSELINNVIIVGAEPTGCEAFVAALLSNQVTASPRSTQPIHTGDCATARDADNFCDCGVTPSPSHAKRCGNTPCALDEGHEGLCSCNIRETESLSDQITKLPFPPHRAEDTLCDEDFTIECNVTGLPPSAYEQLADRLTDHVMKKRTEDNVCIAADMASDDGYCGSPEFCDCARFAAQREDALAHPVERPQAWCLDRPDGTVVFIGSQAAAEKAAAPMTSAGRTELMINGPYEYQFEQDPLSQGAEPGHDMGAGGSYIVEEKEAPSWMRVIALSPRRDCASTYEVTFKGNHVFIGDIVQKEDGYYDFWPDEYEGGYWSSYVMRAIADVVDELNEPWDRQIQNDPTLNHP